MKISIAEWILSLVLPPDRAASVVGDFAEEARRRGYWFWREIFRTLGSVVWRDLAGNPGFWTLLAIRAWTLSTVGMIVLFFGFMFALTLLAVIAGFFGVPVPTQSLPPVARDFFEAAGLVLLVLPAYWAGRYLGRRAPNRELTAAIAASLIPTLVMNVLGYIVLEIWGKEIERFVATHQGVDQSPSVLGYFPLNLLSATCILAGAIRVRRNSTRSIAS